MDGEGLLVPKMHAVLQMLAFLILWGAIDNARLGDAEKDHQPYVKKAVRRTRQWETTFEDEVLSVADRIDAMLQIRSEERDSLFSRARRAQAPPTTAKPVCNQKLLLPIRIFVQNRFLVSHAVAHWPHSGDARAPDRTEGS